MAGCDFDNPQPPASNHFAALFVYHAESRALHVNDCLCYFDSPGRNMGYDALWPQMPAATILVVADSHIYFLIFNVLIGLLPECSQRRLA